MVTVIILAMILLVLRPWGVIAHWAFSPRALGAGNLLLFMGSLLLMLTLATLAS